MAHPRALLLYHFCSLRDGDGGDGGGGVYGDSGGGGGGGGGSGADVDRHQDIVRERGDESSGNLLAPSTRRCHRETRPISPGLDERRGVTPVQNVLSRRTVSYHPRMKYSAPCETVGSKAGIFGGTMRSNG